jgi:hypothetical protein
MLPPDVLDADAEYTQSFATGVTGGTIPYSAGVLPSSKPDLMPGSPSVPVAEVDHVPLNATVPARDVTDKRYVCPGCNLTSVSAASGVPSFCATTTIAGVASGERGEVIVGLAASVAVGVGMAAGLVKVMTTIGSGVGGAGDVHAVSTMVKTLRTNMIRAAMRSPTLANIDLEMMIWNCSHA